MLHLAAGQGTTTHPESPAEFTAFIKAERERIAHIATGQHHSRIGTPPSLAYYLPTLVDSGTRKSNRRSG